MEGLIWRMDYLLKTMSHYVIELITDGTDTIGDYIISYLGFQLIWLLDQ